MGQKQRRVKDPGVLLFLPWHSPLSLFRSAQFLGLAPPWTLQALPGLPSSRTLPCLVALPPASRGTVPCVSWRNLHPLAPRSIVTLSLFLVTHMLVLTSGRLWLWQALVPTRAGLPTKTAAEASAVCPVYPSLSPSPWRE